MYMATSLSIPGMAGQVLYIIDKGNPLESTISRGLSILFLPGIAH